MCCVLATNQEKYRTGYLPNKFEYAIAFGKMFPSAYVGHAKPTAGFFGAVFSYLSSRHSPMIQSNVLFWDDDIENVQGAKEYGF